MLSIILSLIAPLLSLILLIMGSGLLNTFVPIRLEMEGYSPEVIGLVTSALYVGILIGSLWIDRWIAKVGHIRSFILFALATSALVLLQALWIDPWYWSVLRFFGGICMAGIFIVIESWLLIQSAVNNRGAILSLYLAVLYGALTLGQFLINLSDPAGPYSFYITALFCAASILPMIVKKPLEPKIEEPDRLSLLQLMRLSPLGFFGGIVSGMILAAVYGLVPVYAKEIGLSISEISHLMAMIIFGGLSLQWPLGRMADKGKRRKTLYLASFLAGVFSLSIALSEHHSFLFLLFLGWAFGGFSFTIYPLSMAYTCEQVQERQIIPATGGFVLSYGLGAIIGPILAPVAMELFGSSGLFYFLAAISFILAIIGLKRSKLETSLTDH